MTGAKERKILIVGEVIVDVTITPRGSENKLRLGGVTHAARGMWAWDADFDVAVSLPSYLEDSARKYFSSLGCSNFHVLGYVNGAPNVTLIFDPTEVGDQEYDSLLRDEKSFCRSSEIDQNVEKYSDVLIFPGEFPIEVIEPFLNDSSKLHIDVAYDINDLNELRVGKSKLESVFLSTSSKLFLDIYQQDIEKIAADCAELGVSSFVFKENRGGARVFRQGKDPLGLPAQLGTTINSVGVGDVFAARYFTALVNEQEISEAGIRAAQASSAYSQTTDVDTFKTYVARAENLSVEDLEYLGGTQLPWQDRQNLHIYIAAPDFDYIDRSHIERVVSSLRYHNFSVRRPVLENGQLPLDSSLGALQQTYDRDIELLNDCCLVFAIPLHKDPGTLVELGIAIERGIPVVVYDPNQEANNTMVVAGANTYSSDIDCCLNAVFTLLSKGGKHG